jgi:flagella basal body P-ring formation protein FlgA
MPQPGSHRTLHAAELLSLAQRYGIEFRSPADVCFEWPMESLDRARVVDAMLASLDIPNADITIAETSLTKVPRGRVEFPRDRLGVPASPAQRDPVLWRGDVIYGEGRHFPIWARVRIQVACDRLVATESLRSGQPLEARQVRQETITCFPGPKAAVALDQAIGLVVVRPVSAGAEIRSEFLTPPNQVNRGDTVAVEVHSGGARLAFSGKAESSGRNGDLVAVRNPTSNRIFQARVDGRDKVTVQAGGGDGTR